MGSLLSRWWLMRWLMLSKTLSFVRICGEHEGEVKHVPQTENKEKIPCSTISKSAGSSELASKGKGPWEGCFPGAQGPISYLRDAFCTNPSK
jgi:hypothetical protein